MKDEDQQISAGLKDESLAEKVKRRAETYTSEQLYKRCEQRLVKTVGEMAELGADASAIREREKGGFKKFFEGRRLAYEHALHFIHCAEIVDRNPKFAMLKSSRAVRQLFSLTKPNQDAIAEAIEDAPIEDINHMLKGEITKLHNEIDDRKVPVGGRGDGYPLGLLHRWTKEIYVRLEKIYFHHLSEIEESERDAIRLELWNRTEASCARLKDPNCNPLDHHSADIEIDDKEVETPVYDISEIKARAVRPTPNLEKLK
jgi:hypothetical protein